MSGTEPSPAACWPCPLTPPCRRLGVPLSGFCFRKQCSTAWGSTGPGWGAGVPVAPVSCPGGVVVEARVGPGRPQGPGLRCSRLALPLGAPIPGGAPRRASPASCGGGPLGGRLTPRGGVGAGAAGLRALGRVWVLFVGLPWPHVQSTGRAREVFAVAVSATPAVLMLPISA